MKNSRIISPKAKKNFQKRTKIFVPFLNFSQRIFKKKREILI